MYALWACRCWPLKSLEFSQVSPHFHNLFDSAYDSWNLRNAINIFILNKYDDDRTIKVYTHGLFWLSVSSSTLCACRGCQVPVCWRHGCKGNVIGRETWGNVSHFSHMTRRRHGSHSRPGNGLRVLPETVTVGYCTLVLLISGEDMRQYLSSHLSHPSELVTQLLTILIFRTFKWLGGLPLKDIHYYI